MAHVNSSSFHSTVERRLRDALLAQQDRPHTLGPTASRRRPLSSALRLTRASAPGLMEALAASQEALGHEGSVELFVHPEQTIRAVLVSGPPETPALLLSSRLLEAFSEAELRFVLGRALGHWSLGHFPFLGQAHVRSLRFFPWLQAARASADRAGLVCAREVESSASALFKLASGLSTASVKSELQARTRDVEHALSTPTAREAPREDEDTLGCFITHAFSPTRLRALVTFSLTRTFRGSAGLYGSDEGLSDEEADALLTRDLEALEPASPDAPRGELLRQALEAGTGADPGEVLSRVRQEATLAERARLVQQLTWVAATDGLLTEDRLLRLLRAAKTLSLPAWIVDEALRVALHPVD